MLDREKVVEALEMSYKYSNVDEDNTLVPQWIVLHAIALLKAQEPVTAVVVLNGIDGSGGWWYQCPTCKMEIEPRDKYCRNCGQAVKWK